MYAQPLGSVRTLHGPSSASPAHPATSTSAAGTGAAGLPALRAASRRVTPSRLRGKRSPLRGMTSRLRAVAFSGAVGVVLVGVLDAWAETRVVVAIGGRRRSTTLGRVLADLVAGRDPWPASSRWLAAVALVSLVLLTGSLCWVIRRRRRRAVRVVTPAPVAGAGLLTRPTVAPTSAPVLLAPDDRPCDAGTTSRVARPLAAVG